MLGSKLARESMCVGACLAILGDTVGHNFSRLQNHFGHKLATDVRPQHPKQGPIGLIEPPRAGNPRSGLDRTVGKHLEGKEAELVYVVRACEGAQT